MNRTCLDCGIEVPAANRRCERCQQVFDRKRNQQPHRALYLDPVYRSYPKEGVCHICHRPIPPGEGTRDHVIPLIAGGTNDPSNIAPAHRSCNSSKGGK